MRKINYLLAASGFAFFSAVTSLATGTAMASSSNSKTIEFAYWGDVQENTAIKAAVSAFEKSHPNIHVNALWITGNYNQKLLTMIAGGTAPDVIQISNSDLPGYIQAFSPVHVNPNPYLSSRLVNELKVKGTLYAYPFDVNPKVMTINISLFQKRHVPLPSLTKPMSPAQFQSDAMKLTYGSGAHKVWGSAPLWYGDWLYMFGGRLFNAQGTKSLIGSPQAIAAANFVIDSSGKYHYAPTAKESAGQNMFNWFLSGKVATYTDTGPWYLPTLQGVKGLHWELVPEPGTSPFGEVDGLAIGKTSAHPRTANLFAQWMSTSKLAQDAIGASPQAGYVPVIKSAIPGFLHTQPGHNLQAFIQGAATNVQDGLPWTRSNQIINQVWTDMDNETALGTGTKPPGKVFPGIAQSIDTLLQHP